MLDQALFVVVMIVFVSLISVFSTLPTLANVGQGVLLLVLFLFQWGYGAFFETVFSGRTPGKFILSLRVVRDDGGPARFPDYVLRNLMRTADWLPMLFGIGIVSMFLDRKLRRLGDLVAGTVVVVEERASSVGQVIFDPPITDEERQNLPPRVILSRDEIEVIEAFLRRRRMLSAERAEELAVQFGPRLSERTGVVAPTSERVLILAYARATGKDR